MSKNKEKEQEKARKEEELNKEKEQEKANKKRYEDEKNDTAINQNERVGKNV